ncbi:coiled-coil domain-containing protein 73 isoform X2 [Stigmatopora argus]
MDSGLLPHSTLADEAVTLEERSLISTPHEPEKRPTILLHLLEFKTHLLEAVEELHIRRDAETQFENQISKVVLEKQEIGWKKESLQHQMITAAKHHAEALINVEKQFQIKIRNTEEEKGKFQVISELKEKEISNLKEELKSLQLLKYNFEKKANELEQKQTLQSRSKDRHLIQIGEIEKRFAALARQCSTLKKSHTQLEENVDEVMKRNTKLTATNEKHEATIQGLVKEKEMNNKLREENVAKTSEKQEVINVLQYTQQFFLNQVHAVNRLELQLQTQEGQYKALEQEHEEMREKTKSMKEKITHLMRVQQEFQALKEVHDDLQQKLNELSAQVKVQAHTINELEIFPSLAAGSRRRPPDEPKSSSMLSFFGSLQNSAVSQNRILDCLEDTSAKTKLDGEMGGQGPLKHDESFETQLQVQCEMAFSIQSPKNFLGLSETIDSYDTPLNTDKSISNEVPNVISSISHQPANDVGITESLLDRINTPNTDLSSNDLQTNNRRHKDGSTSQNEADSVAKENVKNTSEKIEGSTNENQSKKTEDDLEEICVDERDEIPISQTANSGNIQEKSSLCAHKPKQETTAEFRYGENEGGKTGTEMEGQATCSLKSNTSPDIDAMVISAGTDTVCEPECYQNLTEKVADNSLVNITEGQLLIEFNFAVDQSLNSGDISLAQDAQDSCKSELQTNAERVKSSPTGDHSVIEKTKQVGVDESISTVHTTFSELLSESADLVTNQTMAEYTNFEEVKKTIVEPGIQSPDEGIQEVSNGVTAIFESDACQEVCGINSQREPVTSKEDLIISNPDNGEASKKIESDLSGSLQSNNGLVETLDVGTICLQQPVINETLCDAVELPALPVLKTHQPSFDWHASKQMLSMDTPDSILQSNVQKSPVSEQNASNALCSTQHSKEPLMIIRAFDLLKASKASASTGFGWKHKLTGWNVFGKNFRDTAATDKGGASLSASTWPVSSTWSTPSGTSVAIAPPKSDVHLISRGSQEEQSSIRAQISKIEQFLETESVHQFERRRTHN